MKTVDDEIIQEIRKIRTAHAAAFDFDVARIVKDLQREERESGREVITRPPRRPKARRVIPHNRESQPPAV